jgi:hypothetical protein
MDECVDEPVALLPRDQGHEMPGPFTVVSPGRIRVRRAV